MSANGDNPEAYTYPNPNDTTGYEQYDSSYYEASGTAAVKPETTGEYHPDGSDITDSRKQQQQQWKPDAQALAMIEELKKELETLDPTKNKHAVRVMNAEIERLSTFGEPDFLEVDVPKQIKILRKIMVPVHRDPKFNFVGKLLGPGGRTLQNLISSTRCRIYILGRGSSREKAKEEELLASGDPKYAHFKETLFVRVEAVGTAAVAYQKIAQALNELQYYLQPVRDDIYLQQMADMGKPMAFPPVRGGMRGALMGAGPPRGLPFRGSPRGAGPPARGRVYLMQTPPGQPPTGQEYDYSGYEEYQNTGAAIAVPQYDSGQVHMTPPRMPPPHLATVGPPRHPPPPPPVTVVQQSVYPPSGGTYVYDYTTQSPTAGPRALVPGPPRGASTAVPPPPPPGTMRGRGIVRGRIAIGQRPAPY